MLAPAFNDPNDRVALNMLAELFPDREVVGIRRGSGTGVRDAALHDAAAARKMIALAAIPALIWLYLLIGRGGFWRISKNLPPGISRPRQGRA